MQEKIKFHYALQLCDIANRECNERYVGHDRTTISKKSVKSLLLSIKNLVSEKPFTYHYIKIFNDRSSIELIDFVNKQIDYFVSENIHIELSNVSKPGIYFGIRDTYFWLQENGKDFVFQVQDDYLFEESAMMEMAEVFFKIKNETGSECLISPYNDSWLWELPYKNISTPRVVIVGKHRYWIQYYDMSCSFFTSHNQFSQHWDLYDMFFALLKKIITEPQNDLENKSLNLILTRRGVLGIVPITSLALHLQSELEKDPHIDWEDRWNKIDVT